LFFLCTHYVGLLILSGTLGIHILTCLNETNLFSFAIKKLWHQVIERRWEAYEIIEPYALLWVQVEELEKEILDSRQKIEFYRVKMQELVSVLPILFFSFMTVIVCYIGCPSLVCKISFEVFGLNCFCCILAVMFWLLSLVLEARSSNHSFWLDWQLIVLICCV
jgi:hypothetical protein